MDKIKIKLANPYLTQFGDDSVAQQVKIITFPSKPISFSPAYLDTDRVEEGAGYIVKMENGKYAAFYVTFLLAQINEISPDYLKTRADEFVAGEISAGMDTLYANVLKKKPHTAPIANLNRYSLSITKSASNLNELLGRGVDLDVNYTYQLSWSDEMSTNTINSSKYVLNVDGVDTIAATTPNPSYPGLNNWAGTSYTSFWCAGLDAGEQSEGLNSDTEARAQASKGIEACMETQMEAFGEGDKA